LITSLLTFLLVVLFISEIYVGAIDSITHYHFARYAFLYPEFYLNHWAKPLFTLLCSPFAQFGYKGAATFNILSGILAATFAWLTARNTGIRNAWVIPLIIIFIPVYFNNLFTSLTEVLFSLVLIASIYAFSARKYTLSAIIISFILFARTEGLMYLLLIALALVMIKKFRALPWLLTGFMIYGLAGIYQFDDFFWFYTQMPYGGHGSDIYGSGNFWEYFLHADKIIGIPMIILLLAGTIYLLFKPQVFSKQGMSVSKITLYILVIPAFWGFVLAQSFLWWKGLFGVLFSYRFMVCVMPLAAIIAAASLDLLLKIGRKYTRAATLIIIGILVIQVYTTIQKQQIPFKVDPSRKPMMEAAEWIRNYTGEYNRIFYFDPSLVFYLDLDPYDRQLSIQNLSNKANPQHDLEPGEILVYDTHFGGFENRIPHENLEGNPYFTMLKDIYPEPPFNGPGDIPYHVTIYRRDLLAADTAGMISAGFEEDVPENILISNEISFKGDHSQVLDPDHEYSMPIEVSVRRLSELKINFIRSSASIMIPNGDPQNVFLVFSAQAIDHTTLEYKTATITTPGEGKNGWHTISLSYPASDLPANTDYVKVYVWHQGSDQIYVDDIKVILERM